jgi:hypothetical protein
MERFFFSVTVEEIGSGRGLLPEELDSGVDLTLRVVGFIRSFFFSIILSLIFKLLLQLPYQFMRGDTHFLCSPEYLWVDVIQVYFFIVVLLLSLVSMPWWRRCILGVTLRLGLLSCFAVTVLLLLLLVCKELFVHLEVFFI